MVRKTVPAYGLIHATTALTRRGAGVPLAYPSAIDSLHLCHIRGSFALLSRYHSRLAGTLFFNRLCPLKLGCANNSFMYLTAGRNASNAGLDEFFPTRWCVVIEYLAT